MKHEHGSKVSTIEEIDRIMHFSMTRTQLPADTGKFVEYSSSFFASRKELRIRLKVFKVMVAY